MRDIFSRLFWGVLFLAVGCAIGFAINGNKIAADLGPVEYCLIAVMLLIALGLTFRDYLAPSNRVERDDVGGSH